MNLDRTVTFPGCPEVTARATAGDAVMQTGHMCSRLPLNPLSCLMHAMYLARVPFWSSRDKAVSDVQLERFRFVRDLLAKHFSHVPTGGYNKRRHYQPRYVSVCQILRVIRDITPVVDTLFTRDEQPALFRILDNTGVSLERWLHVWEAALSAYCISDREETVAERIDPEELFRDIFRAVAGKTLPRPAAVQTAELSFRERTGSGDETLPATTMLPMSVAGREDTHRVPVLTRVDTYQVWLPDGVTYDRASEISSALCLLFPELRSSFVTDVASGLQVIMVDFNFIPQDKVAWTIDRVNELLATVELS